MNSDFPTGDPHCPECKGTGIYRGFSKIEPCRTCTGSQKNATIDDVLDFMDACETMQPGIFNDKPDSAVNGGDWTANIPLDAPIDASDLVVEVDPRTLARGDTFQMKNETCPEYPCWVLFKVAEREPPRRGRCYQLIGVQPSGPFKDVPAVSEEMWHAATRELS